MNEPPAHSPLSGATALSLRPERPEDEAFLFEVYAGTREEELAMTGWDAATRAAFLRHQFLAMRRGYASMFPFGEFSIITLDGQSVGRMVVNRTADEIHIVDLALLPIWQGKGIGTRLMEDFLAEARKAGRPVRLQVLKNNRALRLYARLGFRCVADSGVYESLEWSPAC